MTARLGDKDKTSRHNTENRRANKPLMEKRRRARINQSLALLKTIVVDSNKIEASHKHSKLEKADILELTVKHLQTLQSQQQQQQQNINVNDGGSNQSAAEHSQQQFTRFQQGFEECSREVVSFLQTTSVDKKLTKKLLEHLSSHKQPPLESSNCSSKPSSSSTSSSPAPPDQDDFSSPFSPLSISRTSTTNGSNHSSPSPCPSLKSTPPDTFLQSSSSPPILQIPQVAMPPQQQLASVVSSAANANNNIHVIPTRLPNGRVVFLLPGTLPPGGRSSNNCSPVLEQQQQTQSPPAPVLFQQQPPALVSQLMEEQPLDFRKRRAVGGIDEDDDEADNSNNPDTPGALNLSCKRMMNPDSDGDSVWRPW